MSKTEYAWVIQRDDGKFFYDIGIDEYLISNWKHIPSKTYKQQANQKKKRR